MFYLLHEFPECWPTALVARSLKFFKTLYNKLSNEEMLRFGYELRY